MVIPKDTLHSSHGPGSQKGGEELADCGKDDCRPKSTAFAPNASENTPSQIKAHCEQCCNKDREYRVGKKQKPNGPRVLESKPIPTPTEHRRHGASDVSFVRPARPTGARRLGIVYRAEAKSDQKCRRVSLSHSHRTKKAPRKLTCLCLTSLVWRNATLNPSLT